MHEIIHALEHGFLDTIKILPFLIITFAVLEIFEARVEEKSSNIIQKSGKSGPFIGALFGLLPQCGFSVLGSNFYAKRIITLGTLIAIYLSTSDEALLVMLASPEFIPDVLIILGLKFLIGVGAGFLIDLVIKSQAKAEECHHCHHNEDGCENEEIIGEDHCCSHTDWKEIIKCTVKRTVSVFVFVFFVNFIFTYAIELIGEEQLRAFMLSDSVFQPLLTALIGLIPNCAPSVILAQMYINGACSLGAVVGGLCTGAGVGLAVLFHVNRGVKSNLLITVLLYFIGAGAGVAIQLIASAF